MITIIKNRINNYLNKKPRLKTFIDDWVLLFSDRTTAPFHVLVLVFFCIISLWIGTVLKSGVCNDVVIKSVDLKHQ